MNCKKCGIQLPNENVELCESCANGLQQETVSEADAVQASQSENEEPESEVTRKSQPKEQNEPAQSIPAQAVMPVESVTKKKRNVAPIIIAVVIIIAIAAGAFAFLNSGKSSKVKLEDVSLFSSDRLLVSNNGKYGYVDLTGKVSIDLKYDDADSFCDGLAAVTLDGKPQIIDTKGKVVLKPDFDEICKITNSKTIIVRNSIAKKENGDANADDEDDENPKWAYYLLDKNGKMLVQTPFDDLYTYSDEYGVFESNNHYGIINIATGEIIINAQYDDINSPYTDTDYCRVSVGDKCGIITLDGKFLLNPTYDDIDYSDGYFVVEQDDKYGVLDSDIKELIPVMYDEIEVTKDGYFVFNLNGKCGVLDNKNKQLIQPTYDRISISFSECNPPTDGSLITPWINYTSDDNNGREAYHKLVNDGLIVVANVKNKDSKDMSFGYINLKNEMVISPQFNTANPFINGQAIVSINGKYGIIDPKGTYVINPVYDEIVPVSDDLYRVCLDEKYGIINRKGDVVASNTYDDLDVMIYSGGKYFMVTQNDKSGVIDTKGQIVVSSIYPIVKQYFYKEGFIVCDTNKKYMLLDKTGNIVTQGGYDTMYFYDKLCIVKDCYDSALDGGEGCFDHTCRETGCYAIVEDEDVRYCADHKRYSYTSYCEFPGCYNKAYKYGYCYSHYLDLMDYIL